MTRARAVRSKAMRVPESHRSEGACASVGVKGGGAHDGRAGGARRGVGAVHQAAPHARQRTPCAHADALESFNHNRALIASVLIDALSSWASRRPSDTCARQPAASKAQPAPSGAGTTANWQKMRSAATRCARNASLAASSGPHLSALGAPRGAQPGMGHTPVPRPVGVARQSAQKTWWQGNSNGSAPCVSAFATHQPRSSAESTGDAEQRTA